MIPEPQEARKLRSQRHYFHRLIQTRSADSERRGLQRKALEATADFQPMRAIIRVGGEYRKPGRAANVARIFFVLCFGIQKSLEQQTPQPPWH